jgi:hypothetical protein
MEGRGSCAVHVDLGAPTPYSREGALPWDKNLADYPSNVVEAHSVVPNSLEQKPLEKIRSLPPEKAAEVEDFVDFLSQCKGNRQLAGAATGLSEASFHHHWARPDDAEYDQL